MPQTSPIPADADPAEPLLFAQSVPLAPLNLSTENGDLANGTSICVRLDLEDLPCFAMVDRYYEPWGVLFDNAIAIRPSNPAFPPHSGMMVMLGAPKSGWVEATFLHPVQYVSSFITSSRKTVMSAFNSQNQLVAQTGTVIQPVSSGLPQPNLRLSLNAQNIYKVKLQSFNGELTLDDFCFCG